MKVLSVGGGPAGLYFSILLKKRRPDADVTVFERNRPEDTFGWGVVFSRETLGNLAEADPEVYEEISRRFAYWDDIETHVGGECITSTGHGFCGLARRELLMILQRRCEALGVRLQFQHEVVDLQALPQADLVLAADGVHSLVRERFAAHFQPKVALGRARFCWLGTTLCLRAFTFVFKESPHGLFQVHAYPFDASTSTWIVECHEDVWRKAGLDEASEAKTVAFCEELFAEELKGHRLLSNKSIWRTFPTVRNARWHHQNLVLMGDAAHTAHFSIGSGTKLAMEDAIALADAVAGRGRNEIPSALRAYEAARRPEVEKLQAAASVSQEWFEQSARHLRQSPAQFTFNLMTRSGRITYENLKERDPALVQQLDGASGPPAFAPLTLRGLTLRNRVAAEGAAQADAALLFSEPLFVSREGRRQERSPTLGSPADLEKLGAWVRAHRAPGRVAVCVRLTHAGRKAKHDALGPTDAPFEAGHAAPRAMTAEDAEAIVQQFVGATKLALEAGADAVEVDLSDGQLLASFLSPLSNTRTDALGGKLQQRLMFPRRVLEAVREALPAHVPLVARLSALDWAPGGLELDDGVELARAFAGAGVDLFAVTSGGNAKDEAVPVEWMYQVPLSERLRLSANVRTLAMGRLHTLDHAHTVVGAGRADVCLLEPATAAG